MNKAPWIFASIALLTTAAAYGCGNGGTTTTTTAGNGGSTASSTHSSSHAASSSGAVTGTGGGGVGGAGGASVACNPFTGAPCMVAAGESCDFGGTDFICYPPPNDVAVCGACDDQSTFCKVGLTCLGECTAFCCTDADCGAGGKCDLSQPTAGVGICAAVSDAGADAGAMAACNSPATPPSAGSCYKP